MKNVVWRDIPDYEGLYQINNVGQIMSLRTGQLRQDVQSGHGYRAVQLSDQNHTKKRFYVHRLVAITFLGAPSAKEYVVNHKNLNKKDNRVENLEWTTNEGNMHHAYINGKTDFRRQIRIDNKSVSRVYPSSQVVIKCLSTEDILVGIKPSNLRQKQGQMQKWRR